MAIFLSTTTALLKVITGSAGAIDVITHWSDIFNSQSAQATFDYESTNTTQIAGAATTTIVASPGLSTTRRNVKHISIRNASATVSNAITISHTDGSTLLTSISCTLYPSDALHYNEGTGWQYIPAAGSIQVPGRLLLVTVKTTGTTFTTGALTNSLRTRQWGGGGGGAGCTSVVSAASAGGGGGAGGYGEKFWAVSPSIAYTYAIGAAGAANSGAGGGNGGDTTMAVSGTTVTAKGGTGAVVATASASLTAYAGGAGGVVGSNGDINASGMPGDNGITLTVAGPVICSGQGGSTLVGAGGAGLAAGAVAAGNAGTGNGSGGGGAATGASTVRAGGAGTVGLIIFEEYS